MNSYDYNGGREKIPYLRDVLQVVLYFAAAEDN